ncbi:pleckstrin homology domain-containing family H member 3 [Callorhinchus milii]|uniref:pleckstrin homology domain-containing family H member 3 n=1 Tax=Callorhinchus milii TaxID=7868 RepID=UPI00045729AE|nr:pleckstrin homology domain-containing family H member 3 [Callorhinchus milii]|eukprot:gi/632966861/ref/XP_007899654.1/ PREDICTED: pleckstrin homology domain-containing family H member 3 [Callorhinchus milii]
MPLWGGCLFWCCRQGFTVLGRDYGEVEREEEELQELRVGKLQAASSDLSLTHSVTSQTPDRSENLPEEMRQLIIERSTPKLSLVEDKPVIIQGWLHRGTTPWLRLRRHWFVLTQDSLDYYTNGELNAQRLGMLVLTSLCSVIWPDKNSYKETGYWRVTVHGRRLQYRLYSKHLNEAMQWASAIQSVIDSKAPVDTPTQLLLHDIQECRCNPELLEHIYNSNPILQYTQKPLYAPLLPFPYGPVTHNFQNTSGSTTLQDEAVKIFNSLQQLEVQREPVPLIQGVLQTGLELRQLRDEMYCQLVKQTTSPLEPGGTRDLRYWQLLTCMAVTFHPSSAILRHLHFHLARQRALFPGSEMDKYAEFITDLLRRSRARECVPSWAEIRALTRRQQVSCTVHCAGAGTCSIAIGSHTTAGEVVKQLIGRFGLGDSRNIFALFQQCGGEEHLIASSAVVADILSRFENLNSNEEEPEKQGKLHFKLYCVLDQDIVPKESVEFSFLLEQAHEMVTKGYYAASQDTLQSLAALRLQFTIQDFSTHVPLPRLQDLFPVHILQSQVLQSVKTMLSTNGTNTKRGSGFLAGGFPSSLWGSSAGKHKLEEEQLLKVRLNEEMASTMAAIVEHWKLLQGMNREESMTTYLAIVRECSAYGATVYPVGLRVSSAEQSVQRLWLALDTKAVSLYKEGDADPLESFGYHQISSFHPMDKNIFKIALDKKDFLFESNQVEQISQLMKIYKANNVRKRPHPRFEGCRIRPNPEDSLSTSHHHILYRGSITEETLRR